MAEFADLKVYGDMEVHGDIMGTQDIYLNGGILRFNETNNKLYFWRTVANGGWEVLPFMLGERGVGANSTWNTILFSPALIVLKDNINYLSITSYTNLDLRNFDLIGVEWSSTNSLSNLKRIDWVKPSVTGTVTFSYITTNTASTMNTQLFSFGITTSGTQIVATGSRQISMVTGAITSVDSYIHRLHCVKLT